MTEHWIWLTRCRGLGPVKQRQLLEQFGSPEQIWAADEAALERAGVSPTLRRALEDRSLDKAAALLRQCREAGIRVLTPRTPDFPAALVHLPDGPLVLYLRGKLPDLERRPGIGLVGAREADQRGLDTARILGWQIAGCGGIVITGMARGIDAAAAWGALDRGGAVIGVLGCGPDVVYPRENAALFDRVPEQGCLISEHPPGAAPNARYFPARNRIISALSDGVTVIRAAAESGALITARWAADQGRDVFAVPGPPGEALSAGCNRLLREGALLAECGWDILCQYEYRYPGALREYHGRPPAGEAAGNGAPMVPPTRVEPGRPAPKAPAAPVPDLSGLSPIQQRVVAALRDGPMQLDAMIDRLELPAAELLPQLTLMQMRGIIQSRPGKIYQLP